MLNAAMVPKEFEPVFQKAQEYVQRYFKERKDDPSKGTIEISKERYILVRAASMSIDFFETVKDLYRDKGEEESVSIAKQFLFDIAHAIGKQDARNFHNKMKLKEPIEKLSVGPIHFSYSGWAFVDISPQSKPTADKNYFLLYDHTFSFEADAWKRNNKSSDSPVCIMNAGYSSGWCEESFGVQLVASEIMCKAKGDEACRFIMAHPSKIEDYIREYLKEEPKIAKKITRYEIPGFFKKREIEEMINKQREEQQVILDSVPAWIFYKDKENRFVRVNKTFSEAMGMPKEELEGNSAFNLYPKEQAESFWKDDKEVIASGKPKLNLIESVQTAKGMLWVQADKVPYRDAQGNIIGIIGFATDITKRKQLEEKLLASEQKTRAIFDQTFQFIGLMTIDGILIEANRTALEFSGVKASSVLNKPFWQTPWWAHSPELQEKLRQAIKSVAQGEFARFEATHLDKNGALHFVDFSLKPVKDESGKVVFIIPEGRDITERKKSEQELKDAYEQLKQMQQQLIQSAKMASIGILATGVAHEINNPLTAISGQAEMLLKYKNVSEDTKKASKIIVEQSQRIKIITESLLEFSHKRESKLEPLDINDAVEKSVNLLSYQAKAQAQGIKIIKQLDSNLPKVLGDTNHLQEVFLNIMMNATQAMEGGGELTIKTRTEKIKENARRKTDIFKQNQEVVVIEFKDTGIGMDEETLKKAFDPFFTTKPKNTGLGLSICYGIIKDHQGIIEAHSKLKEGATFIIKIPAYKKGE